MISKKGTQAVRCPACNQVFAQQGIWNHVMLLAKGEEKISPNFNRSHYDFLKSTEKTIVKHIYTFEVVAENYLNLLNNN